MSDFEHPVKQDIATVTVSINGENGDAQEEYQVGRNGVTRIEACTKSGMHAYIPYIRVWRGDVCHAEFCQHNIVGVYFANPTP